jgi:hypothetical protein
VNVGSEIVCLLLCMDLLSAVVYRVAKYCVDTWLCSRWVLNPQLHPPLCSYREEVLFEPELISAIQTFLFLCGRNSSLRRSFLFSFPSIGII